MGSASVYGMSRETSGQPQKFKKGPWSSRNRQGRDDFSCEKGRSENGDPSRNLRFRSPIEEMGFYTPAGARWARRISAPTAHAAHLMGMRGAGCGVEGLRAGWLAGWLAGWMAGWLAGWLPDDHLETILEAILEIGFGQGGAKHMDFRPFWRPFWRPFSRPFWRPF